MTEITAIAAELRQGGGKGAARATRRDGRVPGIIYGGDTAPTLIQMDQRALGRELGRSGFFARLFELEVGGEKTRVLARDVQLDPVTDRALHVDFMRVGAESMISVAVPVHFANQDKCPGLRRGGVLNIVRHEIELMCNVNKIPSEIVIDLSGYDIGSSIHISMVKIPEGTKPTITDRDFTVATVAAPTVISDADTDVAATTAEPTAAAAS